VDSFGYLIPKSGPLADSNTEDLLPVHLEISCPSAGNTLAAYLESGVSVDSGDGQAMMLPDQASGGCRPSPSAARARLDATVSGCSGPKDAVAAGEGVFEGCTAL